MPNPEDRVDGGVAERLEFEPVERRKSGRQWGRIVAFLVVVAVLSGGAWALWGRQFIAAGQSGDVPVIRADVAPIKIRPADPGGMDVPDRDKLVYNRLSGEGAGNEVEQLLPPPEEPLPLPDPTAPEAADSMAPEPPTATAEPVVEGMPTALEPVNLEPPENAPPPLPPSGATDGAAEDSADEPPAAPEPTAAPETETAAASSEPPPEPAPEPAASATENARLPTANTYRIQLAALRSQDRAEAEWDRLRAAHTDLLGRLGLSIVRVDLGEDKGIFYRLRAGPLADASAAKALCEKLSKRNVGCLVVRPGT